MRNALLAVVMTRTLKQVNHYAQGLNEFEYLDRGPAVLLLAGQAAVTTTSILLQSQHHLAKFHLLL
jgi:hypothetical protein